MPTTVPEKDLKAAVAALKKHDGNATAAAASLNIARTTLLSRLEIAARTPAVDSVVATPAEEVGRLQDQVYELESRLKASKTNTLDDEYVKRKIIGIQEELSTADEPEWQVQAEPGKGLPGVPTLFCSDWHWGETVFKSQLGGVNEFDMTIAQRRARRLFTTAIDLLRNYTVNPQYPGIVIPLGGDMLTGDIHEELQETNEVPTMAALLDLYGVLRWGIKTMAEEFGKVYLPCVTGNHGRLSKKPRAKMRNFTNYDWLLYQFLAKSFESDKRVQFYIPDSSDALYHVYGHRYLLTHGDQFRGGDGQIGALGPITRGNKKKQTRNAAVDMGYDTMLLGHWHQWIPMLDQIVNGSLKGYDEYAYQSNFSFQLPIQGLWLTHHKWGLTQTWPIYLEERGEEQRSIEWVTWQREAA